MALAGAHWLELITLAQLKKDLLQEFAVFHDGHWSRSHKGYTVFDEIDFVVVNRSGDVLVIEQQNGPVEETKAGLVKRYRDGDSKNPAIKFAGHWTK